MLRRTRNALAEQLARDLWAARGKTTRWEDLASTFIKGDYLRTARRLIEAGWTKAADD
jgi:hypothetical protein